MEFIQEEAERISRRLTEAIKAFERAFANAKASVEEMKEEIEVFRKEIK